MEKINDRLQEKTRKMILSSNYKEELQYKLPENAYLFHGTDNLKEILENCYFDTRIENEFWSKDKPQTIYFTPNLKDAKIYGKDIIAIPIKELMEFEIKRNPSNNPDELETISVKLDEDLLKIPSSTIIIGEIGEKETKSIKKCGLNRDKT